MAILKKVNRLTICLNCADENADRGLNKLNAWLRAFEIEPTSTRRVDQITHETLHFIFDVTAAAALASVTQLWKSQDAGRCLSLKADGVQIDNPTVKVLKGALATCLTVELRVNNPKLVAQAVKNALAATTQRS
jgi:hypothetical protein